jgi:hypothetical protein
MSSVVNLDVSKRLDVTCRKGDTFSLIINVTDAAGAVVDLTTYSFKMEVRATDTSEDSTITNDQLTITGTSLGVITITIPAIIMAGIASGLYTYDLQTIVSGVTQTWLHGVLQVNEDVTV